MKKDFKVTELPKHNIYQVPDGYFDRLPMRVMERKAEMSQKAWMPAIWRPLRLTVAALVLLAVFIGVYFQNVPSQPQVSTYALSSVAETEIIEYLTNHVDLETADFADLAVADQELTADFLNISPKTAEKELEYYTLDDVEF